MYKLTNLLAILVILVMTGCVTTGVSTIPSEIPSATRVCVKSLPDNLKTSPAHYLGNPDNPTVAIFITGPIEFNDQDKYEFGPVKILDNKTESYEILTTNLNSGTETLLGYIVVSNNASHDYAVKTNLEYGFFYAQQIPKGSGGENTASGGGESSSSGPSQGNSGF